MRTHYRRLATLRFQNNEKKQNEKKKDLFVAAMKKLMHDLNK